MLLHQRRHHVPAPPNARVREQRRAPLRVKHAHGCLALPLVAWQRALQLLQRAVTHNIEQVPRRHAPRPSVFGLRSGWFHAPKYAGTQPSGDGQPRGGGGGRWWALQSRVVRLNWAAGLTSCLRVRPPCCWRCARERGPSVSALPRPPPPALRTLHLLAYSHDSSPSPDTKTAALGRAGRARRRRRRWRGLVRMR